MNYMGFAKWADVVDPLYPGDDVVDWIAYDPYGAEAQNDIAHILNRPNRTDWPGFYEWATAKAPDKPIMLGEWGINLLVQPIAPEILTDAAGTIRRQFPMLKALVYWNGRLDTMAPRIDQTTELGIEYGEAYRKFANDEYFNLTSPDSAP